MVRGRGMVAKSKTLWTERERERELGRMRKKRSECPGDFLDLASEDRLFHKDKDK